jgi:hypothetical protein
MAKVKTGETERGNGGREIDRIEETAGTGTTRREGNGPEINERVSKMGGTRLCVAPALMAFAPMAPAIVRPEW